MIMFWIGAALLASGAASAVFFRAARARELDFAVDPSLSVYRRALAEIDDLAERGLIAPPEGRASRAEAGRRLLAAADRPATPVTRSLPAWAMVAAASAAPLLAVGLYFLLGSPGTADQPFAQRLAVWRSKPETASPSQLAAALRALAAERPRDPEPQRRLAMLDIGMGDPNGAAHALREALAIAPSRPDLLGPLGEILVWKAHEKVDGEAQAVFRRLLAVDPKSPAARYFLGRADIEAGRRVQGLAGWKSLLSELRPGDDQTISLSRDIEAVEATGAPAPSAPTADMPPGAMSTAIRGMVEGLAARLKAHPDDPAGWMRLVRAYGVLREPNRQAAALAFARRHYADDPATLAQLDAAARPVQ